MEARDLVKLRKFFGEATTTGDIAKYPVPLGIVKRGNPVDVTPWRDDKGKAPDFLKGIKPSEK